MSAAAKKPYLTAMAELDLWVVTGITTKAMRPFMAGIPAPKMTAAGPEIPDWDFWAGEVLDNIAYAYNHDADLTKAERHDLDAVSEKTVDRLVSGRGRGRRNPEPAAAQKMFRRFHTRDWRGEGDFHPDLVIPDRVQCLGPAIHTLYKSDKLNPSDGRDEGWIEYIHEHDAGVNVYKPARGGAGDVAVPAFIRNCDQFTWLGKSLGFAYWDENDKKCEARATEPLPEIYCTPGGGKALLVIQNKRTLLAILWGGRLAVERRGIVH